MGSQLGLAGIARDREMGEPVIGEDHAPPVIMLNAGVANMRNGVTRDAGLR